VLLLHADKCDLKVVLIFYLNIFSRHRDHIHILSPDGCRSRTDRGSLHSCHKQLIGKKPKNLAYPTSLNFLGDHLRKVRLDRGLSQPQGSKIFKVTTDAVTGWELNRNEPQARMAKRIIQFLGYAPTIGSQASLGTRLRQARQIWGHSQEQAAKRHAM
jgi:DNA-binding transcriptional regulator YiaG